MKPSFGSPLAADQRRSGDKWLLFFSVGVAGVYYWQSYSNARAASGQSYEIRGVDAAAAYHPSGAGDERGHA